MDDVIIVGAMNNLIGAINILAAQSPSGAPDAVRLANAAKNLVDPPPPPASEEPPAPPPASGRASRSHESAA
jgi:hypothetical protein